MSRDRDSRRDSRLTGHSVYLLYSDWSGPSIAECRLVDHLVYELFVPSVGWCRRDSVGTTGTLMSNFQLTN